MASPPVVRGTIELAPNAGWIAGPPLRSSITRQGERFVMSRPGLSLEWQAGRAAHAADDDALCVVLGRPRYVGVAQAVDVGDLLPPLARDPFAMLARLDAGFAIVLVTRAGGRVLLAVDRFSMETLCYSAAADTLSLSERADAVPLARRTISWQSVYDYAYFHVIPAPATIFSEVRRLRHGCLVDATAAGVIESAWWRPAFAPTDTKFAERAPAFRAAVQAATVAEMDATSGCFLSGGTDSSTVAGMACRATGVPVRTYSIGFDEPGYDEMEYARIAARHFGTTHREYYVTAEDVAALVPTLAASVDQPFGNSSTVPAYYCARMAAGDGVTRMLAGDGGDELFGGNTRYRLQQALEWYGGVPNALRAMLEPISARFAGRTRVPGLRQLAGYVRAASVPLPDRLEGHNLVERIGREHIFTADLLREVDAGAPLEQQRANYGEPPASHVIDRMLYYDWKYTLADTDLPKVRTAVALAGLTVGYPLLAAPVVAQALALPPHYKVRGAALRWFFKRALKGFLPDDTLRKKKHGFGMPFGVWMMRHDRLAALAGDSLAALERRRMLRPGLRDDLTRTLLPGHPGYYGELVYVLMMLEQWLAADAMDATRVALPGIDRPSGRAR